MARPSSWRDALGSAGRIVRRFAPYLRRRRGLIGLSLLALYAEIGLRLLEPWPLKLVFDRLIPSGDAARVGRLDAGGALLLAAAAVLIIACLRASAAYGGTVGFALVGNRVLTEVRADLYCHLQTLSLSFHHRSRGGDLTLRLIGDIGLLKDVTVTALLPLAANLLALCGMVGVMAALDPGLTIMALAILPLFWLLSSRLSRRIHEAARTQRRREGAMAATVAESIGAINIVQAFSLQGRFAERFAGQNARSLKDGVKGARLAGRLERTVDILIALATALVLWQGTRLVRVAALTPGDLLVFLAYLKNAFKPARDFAKYTGRLAKAVAAGERVLDLLDREPEVRNRPGAVPAPAFRGAVRFDEVTFAYERRHPAVRSVSLTIPPGTRLALVGPSGGGKSTLVSLLLRLYDPTRGRVLVDGCDIREFTVDSLREQIAVVLQDPLLFAASIRENIGYGAPRAGPAEIEAAARRVGAHEFIVALPEGYATVVGERGATLSQGQRQRIAIARAAVRSAPILILDEPTAGLDEHAARTLMDALERLAAGCTTFLVTHDLRLAAASDQIAYVEGGRVVERGTHETLLAAGGRYAALCRLQRIPAPPRDGTAAGEVAGAPAP